MKMQKDYTLILILSIIGLTALCEYGCSKGMTDIKPQLGNIKHEFLNGEILMPDYVHIDTLIVVNAVKLNELLPTTDGTDAAINELLFTTTEVYKAHVCKWSLCPYKGIHVNQYKDAINNYIGIEFEDSEAFSIDMLHLLNPSAEYDELDSMLKED